MTKLSKNNLFKVYESKPETAMEKTTRVVRQMVDTEAEQRQAKISRLRIARLEREASTPPVTKASAATKSRRTKAASTR
ncbi:hypothetical protein [Thalassobius sp. I31.1]|uniref:hypothetical protein n=1 Tax=Thalassobius sp. I31.1 TaxID=2109912 RepID=UPI000D1C1F42|nr:hypothetical protein [Thalassobius sp. I31.1]